MTSAPTRGDLTPVLLVASGAAALGGEVIWLRHLARLVGATADATALVLAVFMAGLALGALVAERAADRAARPLRGYAIAEAVVALSLFTTPWVARAADASESLDGGPVTYVLVIVALLVPTFAMGTTLPFAMAHRARGRRAVPRDLGLLAGANTAGGIVGLLGAVHWVLPLLGMRGTSFVLGAIASGAALGCMALAGRAVVPSTPIETEAVPTGSTATNVVSPRLSAVFLAVIGLASFALQIAWNRAFAPLFGSALIGFALVAAAILVGLTAGGVRASRSNDAASRPWDFASSRLLALSICVFVGTTFLRIAPFLLERAARGRLPVSATRIGLALAVAGSASYFVGLVTPVLASLASSAPLPGRTTARALVASSVGNVAGALVGAHLLVPFVGPRAAIICCAALVAALALVAAWRAGRARTWGTFGALVVAVPLAAFMDRPWDAVDHAAGPFQIAAYRAAAHRDAAAHTEPQRCHPDARFARPRALFHRDGALASVTLLGYSLERPATEPCSLYSLRSNGRAEGSVLVRAPLAAPAELASGRAHRGWVGREVPAGDLGMQVLGGALAVLGAERPRRALVVGWGTGSSARALLAGSPGRLDAVEIEPAIVEAARWIEPLPQRDRRVTIDLADARIVMRRERSASLDVIASSPSNPWVAAATSLFSREYLTLGRRAIRPGGRFVAWVQLYAVDVEIVRSLLATFRSVFPDVHVIRPSPRARDLLLLGIASTATTTTSTVRRWLDPSLASPRLRAELARAGLDAQALHDAYVASPSQVQSFVGEAPAQTDDDLSVELRSADRLVAGTGDDPERIVAALRGAASSE